MSTKEDERSKALDTIAKIFRDKLDSVAAGDDEVTSDVKAKFEQVSQASFFGRSFPATF